MQHRRILKFVKKSRCIRYHSTEHQQLKTIGRLGEPIADGTYKHGQIFLHKVFGYRGVVLRPWVGFMEQYLTTKQREQQEEAATEARRFYQALVNQQDLLQAQLCLDFPMLQGTMATDNKLLRMRTACDDFVAHDDVLPFTPSESEPVVEDAADGLIAHGRIKQLPHDILYQRSGSVYTRTTEGVRVTVTSQYLGKGLGTRKKTDHCWCISVRIQNLGHSLVRLRYHNWGMMASTGEFYDTKGEGVCGSGSTVELSRDRGVFQYRTWLCVSAPKVEVWGVYKVEVKEGILFPVHIPQFLCQVK